jgi:hypothetical protein
MLHNELPLETLKFFIELNKEKDKTIEILEDKIIRVSI